MKYEFTTDPYRTNDAIARLWDALVEDAGWAPVDALSALSTILSSGDRDAGAAELEKRFRLSAVRSGGGPVAEVEVDLSAWLRAYHQHPASMEPPEDGGRWIFRDKRRRDSISLEGRWGQVRYGAQLWAEANGYPVVELVP